MSDDILFGIYIIFGGFGCGKGTTGSIIMTNEMDDENLYELACGEIDLLEKEKERTFARPPQKHVVFSSSKVRYDGMETYDFEPDNFMLPNNEGIDFDIFPPYSRLHADESHSGAFLSYDWSKMPKPQLNALSRVRHPNFILYLDLQSLSLMNVNVKRFTFAYITPIALEHQPDCFNQISKTISHCAIFKDLEKAMQYEKTKDIALVEEIKQFEFIGDIYDCFDSYGEKAKFYDVDKNKDFIYFKSRVTKVKNNKKMEIIL